MIDPFLPSLHFCRILIAYPFFMAPFKKVAMLQQHHGIFWLDGKSHFIHAVWVIWQPYFKFSVRILRCHFGGNSYSFPFIIGRGGFFCTMAHVFIYCAPHLLEGKGISDSNHASNDSNWHYLYCYPNTLEHELELAFSFFFLAGGGCSFKKKYHHLFPYGSLSPLKNLLSYMSRESWNLDTWKASHMKKWSSNNECTPLEMMTTICKCDFLKRAAICWQGKRAWWAPPLPFGWWTEI